MSNYKPSYICGHCNRDTRGCEDEYKMAKVIQSGYANILCEKCKDRMDREIELIAIKYLEESEDS